MVGKDSSTKAWILNRTSLTRDLSPGKKLKPGLGARSPELLALGLTSKPCLPQTSEARPLVNNCFASQATLKLSAEGPKSPLPAIQPLLLQPQVPLWFSLCCLVT